LKRNDHIADCWKRVTLHSDADAYKQLFYLLNGKFLKFCGQYISDKETSEEIVSDIFVDLWQNRSRLAHVERPEVYMLVSIKNKALRQWKKNSSMQLVPINEDLDVFADVYRPDEELEKKELISQLDKAVAGLPLQCRMAFKLVKEDGMKCAEVAEVLNISVRTVHAQIYRAMKKLNSALAQYQENSPETSSKTIIRNIASGVAVFFLYFLMSACR